MRFALNLYCTAIVVAVSAVTAAAAVGVAGVAAAAICHATVTTISCYHWA